MGRMVMVIAGTPPKMVEGRDLKELVSSFIEHVARRSEKVFRFRSQHGAGDTYEVQAPLVGPYKQQEIDRTGSEQLIFSHIKSGAVPTF